MNNNFFFKTPLIVLASKSPRREQLLKQIGLNFIVVPSNIDEKKISIISNDLYVSKLAYLKAENVSNQYKNSWVIGADTVVALDNDCLGKPGSKEEAYFMLKKLSGKKHKVITGYTIINKKKEKKFSEIIKTDVIFRIISDLEIEAYINTKEPFDKAGSYAIQGYGAAFVNNICGSYTNVVGLPVCEIINYLIKEKVVDFEGSEINKNFF